MPRWDPPFWIGDRLFTARDLELIRWTVRRFPGLSRRELASTICENLPWKAPNGEVRLHACLPLLEQLEAAGLVLLPAKQARRKQQPARLRAAALPDVEVRAALHTVGPVTVEPVPAGEQPVWDATVAAYHPLGYRRAFGAHQRYWIWGETAGERRVLGGFLFASAAKALAVRDAWIGWSPQQRQRFRHRIVANSRFLLLPGVSVPHLASHALALVARRLRADWLGRYGYEVLLTETFVTPPWRGTCYRAANWRLLGETAGRGRQDRRHARAETVKQVWVYPLVRDWRRRLLTPAEPPPGEVVSGGGVEA
jgi:hypothetical protein